MDKKKQVTSLLKKARKLRICELILTVVALLAMTLGTFCVIHCAISKNYGIFLVGFLIVMLAGFALWILKNILKVLVSALLCECAYLLNGEMKEQEASIKQLEKKLQDNLLCLEL